MRKIFVALIVITSFAASSPAWASWPGFKVLHRRPSRSDMTDQVRGLFGLQKVEYYPALVEDLSSDDVEDAQNSPHRALAVKIEQRLNDIARAYEKEGFAPPSQKLTAMVMDVDGSKKYAVYLWDFDGNPEPPGGLDVSARLRNAGGCSDIPQWLEVDPDDWSQSEIEGQGLYNTLAHELFHAIQGTYDKTYGSLRVCGHAIGKGDLGVMVEGGADGAANYLTSRRFPDRFKNSTDRKTLGGFPYRYAFFSPPNGAEYYTNSFWRFLAEKYGGLEYMEHLLKREIKENPTDQDRIKWLDEGLRSYEPIKNSKDSLYTLFPSAVTEIYSYVPGRYESYEEAVWISDLTSKKDNCQRGSSSDGRPVEIVLHRMAPISARCVEIEWGHFEEPVELHIEAIAGSESVADQLHLGMAKLTSDGRTEYCWDWSRRGGGKAGKDSCLEEKLYVQSGPTPTKFAKTWVLDQETFQKAGSARLIIANIAPPPTHDHPDAPGPQGTVLAGGVVLRYGVARTETERGLGKLFPPKPSSPLGLLGGSFRRNPFDIQPRKEFPTVASLSPTVPPQNELPSGDDPRQLLYGIQKRMAMNMPDMPNMFSFVVEEDVPNGKRYTVSPGQRYDLGDEGPFQGVVGVDVQEGQENLISSMLCQGDDAKPGIIGQVVRSNELELRISVSTNLCKLTYQEQSIPGVAGPTVVRIPAPPPYPVVDHLDAVIILPFGWRYFAKTAPQDIVTAGVAIYMARYGGRMEGVPAIKAIMDQALGGTSAGSSPSGASGGIGGSLGGGGCADPWVWTGTCSCCCAELARIKELRKRRKELTPQEQKERDEIRLCALSCTQQYIQCRMNEKK